MGLKTALPKSHAKSHCTAPQRHAVNSFWGHLSHQGFEKSLGKMSISHLWAIFGGSWGSTLALTYAISHPTQVTSMFLRGIFMLRKKEINWFYQEGASRIFPEAWESYLSPIPLDERTDMIKAYYRRLTSTDSAERKAAAKAWSVWEASTSKLIQDKKLMNDFGEDDFSQAFARIECHYFINNGFFEEASQHLHFF